MEKFVVLLVKNMMGLDRGADDSKMEERLGDLTGQATE